MGLRALTRNKRHAANLYEALIAAKMNKTSADAYKRLITTQIAPAAATMTTSALNEQSSSWHMTCWAAAGAAAVLGATATVALSEPAEPPTADQVQTTHLPPFSNPLSLLSLT
jgi:hypothetical protein